MADPGFDSENIRLTVQRVLGVSVTVATVGVVPVLYGVYPDPDNNRLTNGELLRNYICATWSDLSAGLRGQHTLNLDVYTLVGGEDDVSGDQYGAKAGRIADHLTRLFAPPRNGLEVLNFAADAVNPPDTGVCLLVINSRGAWGAPEHNKPVYFDTRLNHRSQRWRFVTKLDLTNPTAVYVNR